MTLLIISPDYASHLLPLATLGTAWRDRGDRVIVASGPATAAIVESFGFEQVALQLGRGSNPGVIRAEEQPEGEDDALRGFFEATRRGSIETLTFQAEARLADLMWEPVVTARRVLDIVARIDPDSIIVDHLAFSARLALVAGRIPHADVVLGHPSALPVGDELYGVPPEWPAGLEPDPVALAGLLALCARVSASFTAEWNAALAELDPAASPSPSAFAERGDILLLNYPRELSAPGRAELLAPAEFLGSAVRDEVLDPEVAEWLEGSPFVYVSFGSFLSVRADVLARVAAAILSLGMRAAIALGSADRTELGDLPADWLVREFLPQVTLLRSAAAAVTHGGNNSVTEAMTYGVPLVVLPFSTDQFAGAAAVQSRGFGEVLDPNLATVDELRLSLERMLHLPEDPAGALAALSRGLLDRPGPERAYSAMTGSPTS